MPTEFTPLPALIGGALIGLAATLLLWLTGRLAGISGIVHGAVARPFTENGWRVAFLLGMVLGAGAWFALAPAAGAEVPPPREGMPLWILLLAGFLVGLGTRVGSGCTSGHGICGLARFSPRSLVAAVTFIGVGVMTVTVVRHVLGA